VNGGSPTSATTGGVGGGSGAAGGNGGLGGGQGGLGGGGGGNGTSSSVPGGPGGIGGGAGGGNTDSNGGFGGGGGNCNANSRGGFGAGSGSGGANPTGDLGFGGGGGGAVASGSQPGGYGGGDSTSNSYSGGGGAGLGGAIFNDAGAVTIANSTLAGNTAIGGEAGAAFGVGGAGGGAGYGGAIFNRSGTLVLTNATLASNSVAGGVGTVASTTADNGAAAGGAIYHLGISLGPVGPRSTSASSTASLTLGNSVLANSSGGTDLELHNLTTSVGPATASVTYAGPNLVESPATVGTVTTSGPLPLAVDPQIQASLQSNGAPAGAPQSLFPLSASSPVINAGSNALVVNPPFADSPVALDQRGAGYARIASASGVPTVDLGAVEVQYPVGIAISGASPAGMACVPGAVGRNYSVSYTNFATLAHATTTSATGSASASVNSSGAGGLINVQFAGLDVPVRGTLGFSIPAGVASNAGGSADSTAGGGGGASAAANATAFGIARTPTVAIGAPSAGSVCAGGTASFPVTIVNADAIPLSQAQVSVIGATSSVQVTGSGLAARTVTLIGITAPVRIALAPGAATNVGCPSAATPQSAEVGLLPTPSVNAVTPAPICGGSATSIALTSTPTGASFNWTATLAGGATTGFAAGSGTGIAQTLNGAGQVDYAVTATLAGCPGPVRVITQSVSQPVITTATLPDSGPGVSYAQQLQASGLLGNATYTLASGALPNGLTLGGSGLVSGIPTVEGLFNFSVQVADAAAPGCTTSRAYSIRVANLLFRDGFEAP
jgi:hypothetical protein